MLSSRTNFIVLLALTIASLVALITLGWRSLNAFESTIARVMQQVSVYTAEQTAQQIQRDLRTPVFDLLEQIDHAAIRRFDVREIAESLRAASSNHFDLIDMYFVWSYEPAAEPTLMAEALENRVFFYSKNPPQGAAAAASPDVARAHGFFILPRLARQLIPEAERMAPHRQPDGGRIGKPFALEYLDFDGHSYQVVYHFLLSNSRPDIAGIEGFLSDGEHLRQNYFSTTTSRWKSDVARDPRFPQLAVSIFDTDGREVFRSGRSLVDRYTAKADFPFLFFETGLFDSLSPFRPEVHNWTVRTGYESGDIAAIAAQQTTPQRLAWLLASLIVGLGVALTARSAVREMRLSEMKSEFVAGLSHDLKTPLAKIQLYADTLRSGRAKSQHKFESYCRVISLQSQKLTRLIQELLDFSKIEAGVREYAMDDIDVCEVLRETIEIFDQDPSATGPRAIEVVVPRGPVRIWGSSEGLQQMFGNLIGNALKYSGGDPYLRIVLTVTDRHVVIAFTDRGIGIPAREHRRIFEKFYRSPTADGTASGSGIGLAIVDHVVRAHHGSIDVQSAPASGTTFTVTLPLRDDAAKTAS